MSDTPQGPGWWQASDGRYYPPQAGQQPPPPPPQAAAPDAFQPGPSGGQPDGAQTGDKGRKGLVLVGAAIVVLLVGGLVAALLVGGGDDVEDDASDTATGEVVADDDSQDDTTTTTAEAGATTTTTTTASSGESDLEVSEVGLSVGRSYDGSARANAGAVITNNGSGAAAYFEVIFTFKNADGGAVGTQATYVPAIDPGGTAHVAVEGVSLQGDATSVDAVVVPPRDFMPNSGTVIPVTISSVGQRPYGGLEVSGTATNPTDEIIQSAMVHCVLRRGGQIVGGVYGFLPTLVPDAEVAWDASLFDGWVSADSAECSAGSYGL